MPHNERQRYIALFAWAAIGTLAVSSGCRVGSHARSGRAHADLVIVNARVWTGAGPSAGQTRGSDEPTSLLVQDGRITAVGSNLSVWSQVDGDTRVIDAGGRRVIPGITDSHTHIVGGGFQLARLNLRDVGSREAFVAAIAEEARSKKKGQWVLGGRWSVESWAKPESPHRSWIDDVTGDVPVFLSRMDGHSGFANSAALKLAGIDASGPEDPKGGEIERDPATGEPTGILKESAMGLVGRLIPDPAPPERYEAFRRAMRYANSLGVTSVHDMCSPADLDAFRQAEKAGDMTIRVTAYLSVSDWPANIERVRSSGLSSDMVRLAGFKGYMDGSLGSRTAYMAAPYSDATPDMPYPRGQLTAFADPPETMQQVVALSDSVGFQLAVHAIGDQAIHLLLDAYEYAGHRNHRAQAQHRVEHTQHLLMEDIPRFARLGVVASMQPFHKADDGRYAEKAIGRERLEGSYAFRQLLDAGALVVFGSDWPVVTLNPFAGVDAAVNARTLAGDVWLPSHSLTVEEAIRAYTVSPPRAIHRDDRLGTIEPGKYADLVILEEDPFAMPPARLGDIKVAHTIVGGKVVYSRSD